MKKGLKKMVAGIITTVALCLPAVGITTTVTTDTASAYTTEGLDHFQDVIKQLSEIKEHEEFDPWFEGYWENNHYRWPNNSKLEIYSAFYATWYEMQYPNRP